MVCSFCHLIPFPSQLTTVFGFFRARGDRVEDLQETESIFLACCCCFLTWYWCMFLLWPSEALCQGRNSIVGSFVCSQRPPVRTSMSHNFLSQWTSSLLTSYNSSSCPACQEFLTSLGDPRGWSLLKLAYAWTKLHRVPVGTWLLWFPQFSKYSLFLFCPQVILQLAPDLPISPGSWRNPCQFLMRTLSHSNLITESLGSTNS